MTNVPILGSKRKPPPQSDLPLEAGKSELRKTRKLPSQIWSAQQVFTEYLLGSGAVLGARESERNKAEPRP